MVAAPVRKAETVVWGRQQRAESRFAGEGSTRGIDTRALMNRFATWPVERCACPLCAADAPLATAYDEPPFAVTRCGKCGLWYLNPRLSAEAAHKLYASDDYFGGGKAGYADYESQERSLRTTFRKLLRTLRARGAATGDLLEVGCGPGYLLDEARAYFERRAGVELSPEAASEARQRSAADVYEGNEKIPPDRRFDCIIATHVIEHIYDPVAFASDLAGKLRPGGIMVLAAPDMGSIFRRVMGRRWPSFKYPEHVSFFDRHTLPQLLRNAGLSAIEPLPYPHAFPLALVLSKLGIGGPRWAADIDVTLPATTVCFMGRAGGTP
jgi:SAM-dependent methyltransferase